MSITTHDRKLLWARAGGICMLCKCRLTEDAKGGDRDVVLGEEAHIVSEKPEKGPRYRPMPQSEVDAYANLMLLCPSDHKIVDEQILYYTEERLHTLKREHEQWVTYRFAGAPSPIRIYDPHEEKPVTLQPITAGKELTGLLAGTHGTYYDSPEPRSSEEAELMGRFLQSAVDTKELWEDIGPSERIRAEFSLSEDIAQLHKAGLVVYAAVREHIIEGGVEEPAPWPVAYLIIYRSNDETVKDSSPDI